MDQLDLKIGIWRYMDVARFLTLIHEKKIYFAPLRELGDRWEGARSPQDPLLQDREYARPAAQAFNKRALISCWHENEGESIAMWKLYVSGREGVAIKASLACLASQGSVDRELVIRRVEYRDIDDATSSAIALRFECGGFKSYENVRPGERALFRKNKGYEHEREIRALIYERNTRYVEHAARPVQSGEDIQGEGVPMDLSHLIQRIVVSPGFPTWAIGSLQETVDRAGIRIRIESSSLLAQPPA